MAADSILLITNGAASTVTGKRVQAGRYAYAVDRTFSGATITLSMLGPDGSSYISVGSDAALTAEGAVLVELPDAVMKAIVSGGPPSAIYATLRRIGD